MLTDVFQVFCGKIPRDLYEDELIPLFEKCGKIWDLRLMMDPMTGLNRGYAFITFATREAAYEAVRQVSQTKAVTNSWSSHYERITRVHVALAVLE